MIFVFVSEKIRKLKQRSASTDREKNNIRQHLFPLTEKSEKPPSKNEILQVKETTNVLNSRQWKQTKWQTWSMYQQMQGKRNGVIKTLFNKKK